MMPRLAMKRAADWLASHAWAGRHFEQIYARSVDPWNCATSTYETLKLQRTADAVVDLGPTGAVLDLGCGEGLLAEALGARGLSVCAIDISPSAIRRARERCAPYPQVQCIAGNILAGAVSGRFEVIVMAEVLYYLGVGPRRRAICARLVDTLADAGHVVVTDPWPEATAIERALRSDPRLELIDEQIHRDPGRSYAISTYRRK
jgi:2-polyprenyl-3-methyl-5-hydroxy-6-metoxy-1,4-benzoquinol methylase